MPLGTSHPDLKTRANKVRAAASDHDIERLHREATGLLNAFVVHADEERPRVQELSRFTAHLIETGQERVVCDLLDLVMEAQSSDDACRCERLGNETALLLDLQVEQERRAFGSLPEASHRLL